MTIGDLVNKLKAIIINLVQSPEKIYLLVGAIGILGFAFITPPFQGPDEESHYIRAQYIAHGYLVPVDVNKSDASLPDSILRVSKTTFYGDDLRGRTNANYELERTKNALKIPFNSPNSYKPQMISYSPLPYLPAIPGIFVSNAVNHSPLVSMYISRVLLGLASLLLVYIAVKIIPYKKYLLAVVGLTPMMLFQQSVVSVDGVSYALLTIFIAFVLFLYSKTNISSKQWLILGAICVGIILAKPLVFLFLPLVGILAKRQLALRWIAGIALVCFMVLAAWTTGVNSNTEAIAVAGTPSNVDSGRQLEVITGELKRFPRVLWNSYMTFYGDDEVRGIIGIFGAADTLYPLWMTIAYAALIGVISVIRLSGERILKVGTGWRLLVLILTTVYFIGVNLALYLSFTPVNFDIVYGVQGRYFLPVLIIFATMTVAGGVTINKKDTKKVEIWYLATVVTLIVLALFITYQRYYLYTP